MRSFSLTPISRSFLRVLFVWQTRAVALRCCQWAIVLAVCSISAAEARPLSHQLGASPPTARCNWQTVNSGFFFPQPPSSAGQEQVADAGHDQVALQAEPTAAFPLVEADFLFLIFEAPLDAPPRERDQLLDKYGLR